MEDCTSLLGFLCVIKLTVHDRGTPALFNVCVLVFKQKTLTLIADIECRQ